MSWTPSTVKKASALVSKVLFNRAKLAEVEQACWIEDMMPIINSLGCQEAALDQLKTMCRQCLQHESGVAIEQLADLGVRNDDWPEEPGRFV